MLHVVLDWQKISKTILEKHFSLYCGTSIFFWFLCRKIGIKALLRGEIFFLKLGHIGYQKIENFMLISKKQTCLSDKMLPKKVKNLKTDF
jgi:hypothetical protein